MQPKYDHRRSGFDRPEHHFAVLSLSFCHLLNDMIAVAGAGDLSDAENFVSARFRADRPDHAGLSVHCVAAAAAGRRSYGQTADAVFAGGRHGLHPDRLLLLSRAVSFRDAAVAAALVGIGSSVFHPESSRVARMASGGRHGLAQSLFQVGGNTGSAIGPLLAAFIVVPHGQRSIAWFCDAALLAIVVLTQVGHWYTRTSAAARGQARWPVDHWPADPSARDAGRWRS